MREIKFKIWMPTIKEMSRPLTLLEMAKSGTIYNLQSDDIFLQYTGLKDKNGREIYEGDILHVEFNEKFYMDGRSTGPQLSWRREEVVFQKGEFSTVVRSHFNSYFGELPSKPSKIHFDVFEKFQNHYEVVGNVFENPELI